MKNLWVHQIHNQKSTFSTRCFIGLSCLIAAISWAPTSPNAFPLDLIEIAQEVHQPAATYVVAPSPFPHTQPRNKLPEEPDEFDQREVEAFYDWRNDMFFRRFDMTGKGTVDFMTARRTYKVWLDDYGTPSVITVADPLFYRMDLNGNGRFEQELGEMWLDSYEDGLTGNEKPYDNSDLQQAPTNIPSWSAPTP